MAVLYCLYDVVSLFSTVCIMLYSERDVVSCDVRCV